MHQFHTFILSWNSTCFGHFVCPSSGVYSLYTQQWCICSCSKAVYKPVWHTPLLSVQWINSWWWADEMSETCRVSWQNKFVKFSASVGFITKKFVTMHGHMNVKKNEIQKYVGRVVCNIFPNTVSYMRLDKWKNGMTSGGGKVVSSIC